MAACHEVGPLVKTATMHLSMGTSSRAFKRAERAGVSVPHWHPMQLRHSIATKLSRALGQQKAQRWLGHTNLKTTDIYVEREVSELIEIAHHVDRLLES